MSNILARLACLAGAWCAAFASLLLTTAVALAEPNTLVTIPLEASGNGTSSDLRFDRNGRFAVFRSEAENLVPGQVSGGRRNVFLYDRIGGGVRMVSHRPGEPAVGGNVSVASGTPPQISADGNWVVYTSTATDMVAGQVENNAGPDVFLWSRATDTTVLASRQAATTASTANGDSSTQGRLATVSDNGRYVVFASSAINLVPGQTANSSGQLYQFDRDTGNVVLISHASTDFLVSANDDSALATLEGRAMSADGRYVVFSSSATNLAPGVSDGNGDFDVYLWDRDAGLASSLLLLSRSAANPLITGNDGSSQAAISADGKFAVLTSGASNLEGVTADTNGTVDVFRYDRQGNTLELISHRSGSATATGNGISLSPVISAGGDQVAFESGATNLLALQNDSNGGNDVFLSRGSLTFLVSHAAKSNFQCGNHPSSHPVIGPDGGVGFSSLANDLVVVFENNATLDVFYRPRTGAAVVLDSHEPGEDATGHDAASEISQLSFGGGLIAFQSAADDLVGAPLNGGVNLFHHGSLVMADGFESGDLNAWSQHFP